MPFITSLKVSGKTKLNPTWEDIEQALNSLAKLDIEDAVTLKSPNEDIFFVIHYVPSFGYYVSGIGVSDHDYHFLCEGHCEDKVEAWFAGTTFRRPRNGFVSIQVANAAMRFFFENGHRDPKLVWELEYMDDGN